MVSSDASIVSQMLMEMWLASELASVEISHCEDYVAMEYDVLMRKLFDLDELISIHSPNVSSVYKILVLVHVEPLQKKEYSKKKQFNVIQLRSDLK